MYIDVNVANATAANITWFYINKCKLFLSFECLTASLFMRMCVFPRLFICNIKCRLSHHGGSLLLVKTCRFSQMYLICKDDNIRNRN